MTTIIYFGLWITTYLSLEYMNILKEPLRYQIRHSQCKILKHFSNRLQNNS